MAQACSNCQWYSRDELRVCPHCGEPLPQREAPGAAESEPATAGVWAWVQFAIGVGVLGLFGWVAYNRYGAPAAGGVAAVVRGWRALWAWLLGPQEQYADFVAIVVLVSALFWFALWLYQRLNR
ncbi:MAG: hypothetical protein ACE5FI_09895 [Anaerolineales bacterium]